MNACDLGAAANVSQEYETLLAANSMRSHKQKVQEAERDAKKACEKIKGKWQVCNTEQLCGCAG